MESVTSLNIKSGDYSIARVGGVDAAKNRRADMDRIRKESIWNKSVYGGGLFAHGEHFGYLPPRDAGRPADIDLSDAESAPDGEDACQTDDEYFRLPMDSYSADTSPISEMISRNQEGL